MTDPSTEVVFIDTNVLVYAHDASETARQPVAQAVLAEFWRSRSGALSTQVLQEFYVVATRRFDPPMSRREARDLVDAYSHWQLVRSMFPSSSPPRNSRNDTPCGSGTLSSSKPPGAPAQPGSSPKTYRLDGGSLAC